MVSWSNLEKLCSCSRTLMVSALACGNKWIQGGTYNSADAWDLHTQRNFDKLEMVLRSSARFVTGNFDRRASVTAMLQDLKWASLATRRHWSRLEVMFRIRFGLIDIPKYRHYDIAYCYIIVPNKSHTLCCRRKEASIFQAF